MRIEQTNDITLWDVRDDDEKTVATVASALWGDGVFLFRMYTKPDHRGKGFATALMEAAIEGSEYYRIYLAPEPFMDEPMTKDQLAAWYERLDFRWVNDVVMIRDLRRPLGGGLRIGQSFGPIRIPESD